MMIVNGCCRCFCFCFVHSRRQHLFIYFFASTNVIYERHPMMSNVLSKIHLATNWDKMGSKIFFPFLELEIFWYEKNKCHFDGLTVVYVL